VHKIEGKTPKRGPGKKREKKSEYVRGYLLQPTEKRKKNPEENPPPLNDMRRKNNRH
jgi:hypothetical protein